MALCVPVPGTHNAVLFSACRAVLRTVLLYRLRGGLGQFMHPTASTMPASLTSVRAIRAIAGSRQWEIRQGQQWIPAALHASYRGFFWVDLRLQATMPEGKFPLRYRVCIWRPRVSTRVWRRLCVLIGAAQRLEILVVRRMP